MSKISLIIPSGIMALGINSWVERFVKLFGKLQSFGKSRLWILTPAKPIYPI
jgi:hypothetical protein